MATLEQQIKENATRKFNKQVADQHVKRTELIKFVRGKYQESGNSSAKEFVESFLDARHYDRDGNFYFNQFDVELLEKMSNGLKAESSKASVKKGAGK
ncbi:MAG: hypothetical protein K0U41_04830 [Gammaproteobacteria bacterium]|nr:hypothetical protein [Gammaproteobacteria bacterium]